MKNQTKQLQKKIAETAKKVPVKKIAIGGGIAAGTILLFRLTRNKNPKFGDTQVPEGNVNQAKVITMASRLWELLSNFKIEFTDRERCRALKEYHAMTDAEFVSVANYYKNKFGKTIRQAIRDLYFKPCLAFTVQEDQKVLARFDELNIP
ncbi:MAG: hypothetical protein AAGJ18_25510 [Bacteroidota bacterium]